MNRNTVFGTLGVSVLLILMGMVSNQEAVSINSVQSNYESNSDVLVASEMMMQKTDTQISHLANASNRFGFDLFQQINSQQPEDNLVFSPSSIMLALAMARNGTDGSTKEEMTQALRLEQLDPENLNQNYQQLIKTLQTADPKVKLAIANSLWANQNLTLKEKFIDDAQEFYQAQVTNLDFADEQTKTKINHWVANNTAQKIPQIIDSVSPEDALYLINAIYFKGIWTHKFDANATKEQPFYDSSGSSQSQLMMNQTNNYRYYETAEFQAVRLPYGEKAELGMYIFLPKPNSDLAEFNQQLNIDTWQEWLSQMRSQKGNISIPRFQMEYETSLVESLSALGMKQVFNPQQADFSAMTDVSVAIDNVKHKSFIEVNEAGTEAAAVTSIGIRITSAMPQSMPFQMNVNRPFFFAIRDDITETILFMGNVTKP